MAQQDTTQKQPAKQPGRSATHFLKHDDEGFEWNHCQLGLRKAEHSVLVFEQGQHASDDHPVVVSIKAGGFSLQEYLSPDEARTLATALLKAAEFAEIEQDLARVEVAA